eukprot:m.272766 g.272766  ORF g.272766 m.272766 type:complete len:58 (-) comp44532_c0_seq1:255-428(-)
MGLLSFRAFNHMVALEGLFDNPPLPITTGVVNSCSLVDVTLVAPGLGCLAALVVSAV